MLFHSRQTAERNMKNAFVSNMIRLCLNLFPFLPNAYLSIFELARSILNKRTPSPRQEYSICRKNVLSVSMSLKQHRKNHKIETIYTFCRHLKHFLFPTIISLRDFSAFSSFLQHVIIPSCHFFHLFYFPSAHSSSFSSKVYFLYNILSFFQIFSFFSSFLLIIYIYLSFLFYFL